jgi:hypothetical protein
MNLSHAMCIPRINAGNALQSFSAQAAVQLIPIISMGTSMMLMT